MAVHQLRSLWYFTFQTFFHSSHMSAVLDSFSLYHVHAPGQESGGEELPKDLTYPTMDELSEQVQLVVALLPEHIVPFLRCLFLTGRICSSLLWDNDLCGFWRGPGRKRPRPPGPP